MHASKVLTRVKGCKGCSGLFAYGIRYGGLEKCIMSNWVHRDIEERRAREKRESEYMEQRVRRLPKISEMTWEEVEVAKADVSRRWDGGWECRSAWAQLKQREAEVAKGHSVCEGEPSVNEGVFGA